MDLPSKLKFSFPDLRALKASLLKESGQPVVQTVTRVACDFGRSKMVVLEVERSASGVRITKFDKASRPAGGPEKESAALKDIFEKGGYASRKLRISVKGQGVIIRFLQFPTMKLEELRNAISFEVDQYIPFKAHEVIWDIHILEQGVPIGSGTGLNVVLVAVRREELYGLVQTFQAAGLELELIDVDALATANALEYFHPDDVKAGAAILDIGTEISTLTVIQANKPRFIRDISYGGLDIIKRLKRKLGMTQEQALQQIEVDKAPTPEATAVIKEALSDLVSDLKVSLNYYLDQVQSAEPVKKFFIEGGGGYHPLVIESLSANLGLPVETMNVLGKLEIAPGLDSEFIKKNQGLLPVPLGLCLRDE